MPPIHKLLTALIFLVPFTLFAQWEPGEVYREYPWVTPAGGEAFLRVGGRYGYAEQPGKFPDSLQDGKHLIWPQAIALAGATRAEIVVEKVMSHEDSRGLRIAVNGNGFHYFPEPATIPEPQTEYMYHTDVKVELPLNELREGTGNRFELTLDSTQRWNWPQNLLYAVVLRVYYPPVEDAPTIQLAHDLLPAATHLNLNGLRADDRKAEYILHGREIDWSGRGVPYRKHWQTHRGEALKILGSSDAVTTAFDVLWNTEWLPEQERPIGVQARVLGADGKYRVSEALTGLRLAPRPYTVQTYVGDAPRNWVTRSGTFEQTLMVNDSVRSAEAMRLEWVSWSPCYSNGVFLNGHLIWDRTHDCYVFATHTPEYRGHDMLYLQQGENVISTALTPLFRGQMVHGMEVQWPGFQLRVKYGKLP